MATKILPIEILQKIFCSQLELTSLYNCLLVSRLWCKTVVPLLWQKPFSQFDKNKIQRWKYKNSLIRTYITCLDSSVKVSLKNSNVILPEELNTTSTFNYASFLQSLNYVLLFQSTGNWIGEVENCALRKLTLRHYLLVEELCKLFFASSLNLKEIIYDKPHPLPHVQELSYIPLRYLEGAEQSLSNLNSFQVLDLIPNEILFTFSQISHHLLEIKIETTGDNDDALASLISVQRNLQKLIIYSEDNLPRLSNALKSISLSSLNHVEIYWEFCIPFDIFCNCSDTLELFSVQQYAGIISRNIFNNFSNTRFTKLHTLKIVTPKLYLDQIAILIRNTQGSLKYIHLDYEKIYGTEFSLELINTIANSCPKLDTLEIFIPDDSISCIVNLLSSCTQLQKISFFTGDSHDDLDENFLYTVDISDVLSKIGKILPTSLHTFHMSHNWITTVHSLNEFLLDCEKNLSKRDGKKLDFRVGKELTAEHIDVIEEFGKRGVLDLKNTSLGRNLQFYRQQIEWKRNVIVNR
ncbi:3660_t:CDS:1 [Funneliformis geosporum]|uniref:7270_t:CDS:1 n=1 Tax=Funneliformis geosporum TaxID=1117311 RepID=A0A9W4WT64_9GLOM|nr:3660_t:CDS:1 [Funneliformis geosporum]CAI2170258.1 7270_t:CDS:1 [Funneliformis geosporum]